MPDLLSPSLETTGFKLIQRPVVYFKKTKVSPSKVILYDSEGQAIAYLANKKEAIRLANSADFELVCVH